MTKKAFRAESGLDAGNNNVINVSNPRANQLTDAVNVRYFIEKNTIQPFDQTRPYDQHFAVTHEKRVWIAKQAINAGPFNSAQWESLRVDPSWQIVTGTGAGKQLQAGDYVSAYSVNSELTFTLPANPTIGDTIVIQDEGMYCHLMSIRVLAPAKPFEDGTGTNIFTVPGSMKTFVYSSTSGGSWIVHTAVDKINSKIISKTAEPTQAAAGDELYRKSSTGKITIQLPKYAVNGDTVSTYDLDELNPVNGLIIQVHPDSGHSLDRAGVSSKEVRTTGGGDLVYRDNIWNIWDGDIRSRWQPITTSVRATPFDHLSVVGMPSNKTVEVTLPKDAGDGDFVKLSTAYVIDGSIVKVKVDDTTTHKIATATNQIAYPKYKDLAKSMDRVPLNTTLTFTGKNYGAVLEFYFDGKAEIWLMASTNLRTEHVDETNRDRPGVAPLASQAEVDKNHEQNPRDDMIVTPLTLAKSVSTETRRGISRIATAAEVQLVTTGAHLNDVIVTPKRLNERQATETIRGLAEVATQTEANTNTNDTHIITPKKFDGRRATGEMAGTVKTTQAATPATSRSNPGGGVYNWADSFHNEPYVLTPKALNLAQATENSRGVAYIGTQSEANAQGSGASDVVMITPKKLDARRATDAMAGIAEIATQAEANAGTDYTRIVTPKTLNDRRATESLHGLAEIATQAEVDAGTDNTRIVTPLRMKTWLGYDHFTSQTATGVEHTGNLWGKVTLKIRPASETQVGTLRVATQTEANKMGADALDNLMITVKKLDGRKATEAMHGLAEIATQAEVDAEAIHTHIVTPKSLGNYIHSAASARMTESVNGTAHTATMAETWVGNDTAGSTQAYTAYTHNPFAVTPRGLNYALQNYLPKKGKAFDADKLDGLDSKQFIRSDVDGTLTGSLRVTKTLEATLTHNSGYMNIKPYNSSYGATSSCRIYYKKHDNGKPETINAGLIIDSYEPADGSDPATSYPMNIWLSGNKVYHHGYRPTPAEIGAYTKAEADSKFVDAAGDTMSGTLKIQTAGTQLNLVDTATSNKSWIVESRGGNFRIVESGVATQMTMTPGGATTFNSLVIATGGFRVGGTLVIETDAKINWNKLKGIPAASISASGIVKLNNSLNSPSQTEAATANTIKILKEMIDEKAGITGAVMNDLKIKNWIRIGNVILRPNPANKTLDFIWTDDPM